MQFDNYDQIVSKYADMLYRVALSYTRSQHDAEDVVQNTFMKLLVKKPVFESDGHIKKWLIQVAVNECRNLWNTYWRKHVDSLDTMSVEPAFEEERHREVYDAVMALPGKYRIVVYLYYYEGYSTKEVGEILGMKDATVRTKLARARKLLRMDLSEGGA